MIHYTIQLDNRYLILNLTIAGMGGRLLYRDTLLGASQPGEGDLLKWVMQEELRLQSASPDTATFNQVRISLKHSFKTLKLLGATGRLFWKGKKLFVDPFTTLKVVFHVGDRVEGIIQIGGKESPLSLCEALFPGDRIWAIREGTVHFFDEEVEWSLLSAVFPHPAPLSKHLSEDLADYPHVIWNKTPAAISPQEPTPCLMLTDRTGAFANLWFDYPSKGKIAQHDPIHNPCRIPKAEKGWENDLLETDFMKKIVGSSHYYCPLDKVVKSLTFLLEIGWPLYDFRGKQIVRQSRAEWALTTDTDTLLIQGKVHYGEHAADVSQVLGAFVRKEKFIDLSPTTVALLEPTAQWEDLEEEEIVGDKILLRKNRYGILEDIFPREQIAQALGAPLFTPPTEAFQGVLHPYQQQGVDWLTFLHKNGFHALLADEMGLGKTVQAIAFFSRLPLSAPLLIVAPTSLLFNWRRELEKFLPSYPIYTHQGAERLTTKEQLLEQRVILTSYTLLRLDLPLLETLPYTCILLDEAHTIKNPDSQTARAAYRLSAHFRIAVTGTPVENRSEDLWSLFHFLMPNLLGERKEFLARVQAAQSDGRYMRNLRKQIHPFLLRRTKEQVLSELPPKIEETVWIEMEEEQKHLYDEYLQKARTGLLKKVELEGVSAHRMQLLEMLLRLRQICCHPLLVGGAAPSSKFERLLEDLETVVSEGRKVLVYSQFTQMLQLIAKELKVRSHPFAYLDGSTTDREAVVGRFQEDPKVPIFLISLKAGGVGLNLTAADYVFIYDPWWNAAAEAQAIDRAHRMGREGTVIAKRYATAWSIEEKIMRLKELKQNLASDLLAPEDTISDSSLNNLISYLI